VQPVSAAHTLASVTFLSCFLVVFPELTAFLSESSAVSRIGIPVFIDIFSEHSDIVGLTF
jgi:hypothetical protein